MYAPFDIRNIDLDGFHKTMALNVDGVVNGIAAVLPSMLARKSRADPRCRWNGTSVAT